MAIRGRLALVAAIAVAATASAPTTATAQVEVIDEATQSHCVPECVLHATGEWALSGHVFGIEVAVTSCLVEYTGHVDESGEGQVESVLLGGHAGLNDCVAPVCALPWPLHLREPAPGQVSVQLEFCFNDAGTPRSCQVALPLSEDVTGGHDYEAAFADLSGTDHGNAPNCEVDGHLHLEGTDLEVVH